MVWLYKIAEVGELRYEAAGNYGGAIQSLLEKASVTGYLPAVYMLTSGQRRSISASYKFSSVTIGTNKHSYITAEVGRYIGKVGLY